MTTTDDTALQEQVAEALLYRDTLHPAIASDLAAAVLPIIRERERAAVREALDGLVLYATETANEKRRECNGDGDWNFVSAANVAAIYRDSRYPAEAPMRTAAGRKGHDC